jgi:hypothetical protein
MIKKRRIVLAALMVLFLATTVDDLIYPKSNKMLNLLPLTADVVGFSLLTFLFIRGKKL